MSKVYACDSCGRCVPVGELTPKEEMEDVPRGWAELIIGGVVEQLHACSPGCAQVVMERWMADDVD